jgi:cytosine/uracil/thiamine/allantoin permease
VPPLRALYDYAWFVGFATSAVIYLLVGHHRRQTGGVKKSS